MKKDTLKVALVQLSASPHQSENIQKAHQFCESAHQEGAEFILFPETYHFRGQGQTIPSNYELSSVAAYEALVEMAKTYKVWIQAGILEEIPNEKRRYNSAVLISPSGDCIEKYQKIHLFEALVEGTLISESRSFKAGTSPKLAHLAPWPIKVGMSICFDLRFPDLYQHYQKKDADILMIPSSFTTETGKAHWHTLCRARAIETQCFVLAPNQVGIGGGGKETYGHSLIIDPWGNILAEGSEKDEELVMATLNLSQLQDVRNKIKLS